MARFIINGGAFLRSAYAWEPMPCRRRASRVLHTGAMHPFHTGRRYASVAHSGLTWEPSIPDGGQVSECIVGVAFRGDPPARRILDQRCGHRCIEIQE